MFLLLWVAAVLGTTGPRKEQLPGPSAEQFLLDSFKLFCIIELL
jgi:hypothetical protein